MRALRATLVKRVCAYCHGSQGFRLWPWSGRVYVTTHTICIRCSIRLDRPIAARPDARAANRAA